MHKAIDCVHMRYRTDMGLPQLKATKLSLSFFYVIMYYVQLLTFPKPLKATFDGDILPFDVDEESVV